MHSSILKRTCSRLLIASMLTSSLITQVFSMEGVAEKHAASAGQLNLSPVVKRPDSPSRIVDINNFEYSSTIPSVQLSAKPGVYASVTREDVMQVLRDEKKVTTFFDELSKCDEENKNEIGRLALQLIRPDMNAFNMLRIISSLAKVADNRAEIVELTKQLIRPNDHAIIKRVRLYLRLPRSPRIVQNLQN
jgi:hypothetical protein